MLAVFGKLGFAGQVGDITASIGLGDSQTDTLVTTQDTRDDTVDELFLAVLDKRRSTDAEAADHIPHEPAGSATGQLVGQEHLVEQIPLLWIDTLDHAVAKVGRVWVHADETGEVAALTHGLVDAVGHLLGLVPLGDIGHDLVIHPLADLGAKSGVALVEVGGVVALVPRRVGVRDHVSERVHGFRVFRWRGGDGF